MDNESSRSVQRKKLQIPSTKLQRSSKTQSPANRRTPTRNLKLGFSLELGGWCLDASKTPRCFGNIFRNLRLEFFERGKLFLIAQPGGEGDYHFLTVNFGGEIEQVNFHAELR